MMGLLSYWLSALLSAVVAPWLDSSLSIESVRVGAGSILSQARQPTQLAAVKTEEILKKDLSYVEIWSFEV